MQIFSVQERYYNVPSASLTPDQIRDQLAELALDVLEKEGKLGQGPKSAAYGEFRDAIAVREKEGGKNKGTGLFDAQKHISQYTSIQKSLLGHRTSCYGSCGSAVGPTRADSTVKIGRQNSIHVTVSARLTCQF